MTAIEALQEQVWPFEVPGPRERSYHDARAVEFLEAAHAQGHKAYMFGAGNFGAQSDETGRGGIIFVRGRHRWEVALGTGEETTVSLLTGEFDAAARAVLDWLAGTSADEVKARLGSQIVTPQPQDFAASRT
jgi:hypothetical protein